MGARRQGARRWPAAGWGCGWGACAHKDNCRDCGGRTIDEGRAEAARGGCEDGGASALGVGTPGRSRRGHVARVWVRATEYAGICGVGSVVAVRGRHAHADRFAVQHEDPRARGTTWHGGARSLAQNACEHSVARRWGCVRDLSLTPACGQMDTSPMPMPRAPRSPWKKTRRGSEADLRFDDDYDSECARFLLSIAAMRRAGRVKDGVLPVRFGACHSRARRCKLAPGSARADSELSP